MHQAQFFEHGTNCKILLCTKSNHGQQNVKEYCPCVENLVGGVTPLKRMLVIGNRDPKYG